MSGGFFRGTSADQDTRFSNKTAKLLKTQKFAPELDHLIDMSKVHLDSLRPWIATRVTQFLGFEDEVLINFIYGLLEGKNADGKQIQIQLTGFMEKNTGKFMKELWGLLTSAQNSMSGIPQQLLDEKAEEARLKKAEEHRVISEVRKKEEERRALEQDMIKKELEDGGLNTNFPEVPKKRSRSLSGGRKSPGTERVKTRNGSPPPVKRRLSQSRSPSPPRRSRRSRSPLRRGRSPNYRRRSKSPLRRAWSPVTVHSPRRRRRSYSRSPRRRSPMLPPRSPRRRRSPQASRSPRPRSPAIRSPRKRYSPGYPRVSPRRRTSPPYSPRYRRRSPRFVHSPARRHYQPPSPGRRRYSPQRLADTSPRRRPHISPKATSPSPRPRSRSSSAEAVSKSPPQHRDSSSSPCRPSSMSPHHPSMHVSSPPHNRASFASSPHQKRQLLQGNPLRASVSPVYQYKPTNEYQSSRSQSPMLLKKVTESLRNTHDEPIQNRKLSSSPPKQQRSPLSVSVSEKSQSRSPQTVRVVAKEAPMKIEPQDAVMINHIPGHRKRSRSSSRESSLPAEEQVAHPEKPDLSDFSAGATVVVHGEKMDKAMSRSSNGGEEISLSRRGKNNQELESDGNENHGPLSPVNVDDRKAAKRRKKEDRRLRKEEKRRKREERHKRKEERRANKALSKGIASVTPPPDFDKRPQRSDDFDSMDDRKHQLDEDLEIEQRKLENELRKKALESIKAKKVVST